MTLFVVVVSDEDAMRKNLLFPSLLCLLEKSLVTTALITTIGEDDEGEEDALRAAVAVVVAVVVAANMSSVGFSKEKMDRVSFPLFKFRVLKKKISKISVSAKRKREG